MTPFPALVPLALPLASSWHGHPRGAASFGAAAGLSAASLRGAGERSG
jgi:hypothetical protein